LKRSLPMPPERIPKLNIANGFRSRTRERHDGRLFDAGEHLHPSNIVAAGTDRGDSQANAFRATLANEFGWSRQWAHHR
jgi:hypothetical protein